MANQFGWVTPFTISALLVASSVLVLHIARPNFFQYVWEGDKEERLRQQRIKRNLKQILRIEDAVEKVHTELLRLENVLKSCEKVVEHKENNNGDEKTDEKKEGVSSYYYFASSGNKFQNNKWDKYDVDAEMTKLDVEEKQQETVKSLKSLARIDIENILCACDTIIGGDDDMRMRRKKCVSCLNLFLEKIDSLTTTPQDNNSK